jgi:anti-sigma28 factor (negative regulator of flagellin synthesis)
MGDNNLNEQVRVIRAAIASGIDIVDAEKLAEALLTKEPFLFLPPQHPVRVLSM